MENLPIFLQITMLNGMENIFQNIFPETSGKDLKILHSIGEIWRSSNPKAYYDLDLFFLIWLSGKTDGKIEKNFPLGDSKSILLRNDEKYGKRFSFILIRYEKFHHLALPEAMVKPDARRLRSLWQGFSIRILSCDFHD